MCVGVFELMKGSDLEQHAVGMGYLYKASLSPMSWTTCEVLVHVSLFVHYLIQHIFRGPLT